MPDFLRDKALRALEKRPSDPERPHPDVAKFRALEAKEAEEVLAERGGQQQPQQATALVASSPAKARRSKSKAVAQILAHLPKHKTTFF